MRYLPALANLTQLRHQAKDLLHAAQRGDPDASAQIAAARTPLEWCQPENRYLSHPGHDEVDRILRPVTTAP
jgi:hypothetical protein